MLDRLRFHVILTGALGDRERDLAEALRQRHPPPLPRLFRINATASYVEGENGRFRLRRRYALSG